MPDYDIRWRLNEAPASVGEGTGVVSHDFDIVARISGSGDPWEVVSGKHLVIYVPTSRMQAILDMPDGPDKIAKYKESLIRFMNIVPIPIQGWATFDIDKQLQADYLAGVEADRADTYIQTFSSYPAYFQMDI